MDEKEKTVQENKDKVFEVAIFVNDTLAIKRSMKVYDFVPNSMKGDRFASTMKEVMGVIQTNLRPVSLTFNNKVETLPCKFSIVIFDETGELFTNTYDGKCYPETNEALNKPSLCVKQALMSTEKGSAWKAIEKKICKACTAASTITFGDKSYSLDIDQANERYFKAWEKAIEAKTREYFNGK